MLRIRVFLLVGILVMVFGCAGGSGTPGDNLNASGNSKVQAQLDGLDTPDGVDPGLFDSLKAEFERQAAQLDRTTSAPPLDSSGSAKTSYDDGTSTVSWWYLNTGDYDQNGEVNVSDLAPLAIHFGETGPFPDGSIGAVIDGDGNGEINLADITPIVIHYQTTVDAYNIYASESEDEIPLTPDGEVGAGARLLELVDLTSAVGDPGSERLQFHYIVAAPVVDDFYWVRPIHGSDEGIPSPRVFVTAPIDGAGGEIELHDVVIYAPEGAVLDPIDITHNEVEVPAGLPDVFEDTGIAHNISVSDGDLLDAPLEITLPYDDRFLEDEDNVTALHVNSLGEYEPVTLVAHDPVANTITIDTRDFSTFAVVSLLSDQVLNQITSETTYEVSWASAVDGWNIANFGSYFSPGGNCLGMAGYAVWWYKNKPGDILHGKYSTAGGAPTSIAHIAATRAHLAQNQYWAYKQYQQTQGLGDAKNGLLFKTYLKVFGQPLIMRLQSSGGGHACVVYGWDATGFKFYEVNQIDSEKHLPWTSAGGFGTYGTYNKFGFLALPSLGRGEDFNQLAIEAADGFTSSQDINLTSPTEDQEIAAHDTQLTGTLGGGLNALATIITYIKGVPQTIPVAGGSFNSTIPVANGENTIIIIAGENGFGKQSTWYRNGATLIRNVKGTLAAADFIATLSWDQNQSDVDLYVTEPGGVGTAWYGGKSTVNGLDLDFDNTIGFGPEHITLSAGDGDTVLPGDYVVRVHYYSDDGAGSISGRVSIVANEGKPNFLLKTIPFTIGTASSDTAGPGGTGPQWRDIATIQLVDTP